MTKAELIQEPKIVTSHEWVEARKKHLAKEKEFTRLRDELSADRRNLPWTKVEKEYAFDSPEGKKTLQDLFGNKRQLIVYHFMFDPEWDEGCKSCSHLMDNTVGSIVHLAARDTAFVSVSRAPIEKIEAFKKRMGWNFKWLSSFDSDFNYDFHVTLDKSKGSTEYNYVDATELVNSGKLWYDQGELPGLSVFILENGDIFRTYSVYQRGLDLLLNTYNFLDLTPLGRQEEGQQIQAWIRHHDKYEEAENTCGGCH